MAITLYFENNNETGVRLDIYRDTQQIDRDNLGNYTPIHTTTDPITEYLDPDPIKGITYYYVFKTTGEYDYKITRNVEVMAVDDRGIGDDRILLGNTQYGYMGRILATSFFTPVTLNAAVGISPTDGSMNTWHKFAYKGKVVYVPNGSTGIGLSYEDLKAAGLIEGVEVQFGIFKYKARLIKGASTEVEGFSWLDYVVDTTTINYPLNLTNLNPRSEWDDLILPLVQYVPRNQLIQNLDNRTNVTMGLANTNYRAITATVDDEDAPTMVLSRGYSTAGSNYATAMIGVAPATATNMCHHLILELIEGEEVVEEV